jgi:hypothetical protein
VSGFPVRRVRPASESVAPAESGPAAPDESPPDRPGRRLPVPRLVEDADPALDALTRRARDEMDGEVMVIFAVLADVSLDATLARLRRLGPVRLIEACCGVLDA